MKYFLIVLILFNCIYLFPQKKGNEVFDLSNYSKKNISILKPELKSSTKYFNNIVVKDVRIDTTSFGFDGDFYFTVNNFSTSLEQYFATCFTSEEKNTNNNYLYIFLKKALVTNKLELQKGTWIGGIFWKADLFYKKDSLYFPLFRFDTTIKMDTRKEKDHATDLMNSCLKRMAEKISNWEDEKLNKLTKFIKLADINKLYNTKATLPILQDSFWRKGVYMSYNEFKNNSPVYTEFELNNGRKTDAIYIKDSTGKSIFIRDCWGYCDGSNLFIQSADNFFKLVRVGNAFYSNAAKEISVETHANLATSSLINVMRIELSEKDRLPAQHRKVNFKITCSPLQLDLDNGILY